MIPGVEITDGTRTFTIAPMNFRILLCEPTKAYVERVGKGADGEPDSFNEAAINLILACGKRNHPDMTRDDVLDTVDVGDVGKIIVAIMTKSGMRERPLENKTTPSHLPVPASSGSSTAPPDGGPTTS